MAKFDFSYGHHLWIVYGNQKVFKKSSKGSTYRQTKNLSTNKKLIDKQKTLQARFQFRAKPEFAENLTSTLV